MNRRSLTAAVALLATAVTAQAVDLHKPKVVKQFGGSTGDSTVAAADTSLSYQLPKATKAFWVVGVSDSTCRYIVQVSPDDVRWFQIAKDSTTATKSAWVMADKGDDYAGMFVRVIQDQIPSPATTAYGAAFIYALED